MEILLVLIYTYNSRVDDFCGTERTDMDIRERIEQLTPEMLDVLGRLVKYDSQLGESRPGMPFGEGPAGVLKEALEIADSMGFETRNLDNYCGYAQVGEGDRIIGLVAHLDIVPPGDGWNTDPFTMTRIGDVVYGRGVSDDKGAAVASLYTLKLLQESGIAPDSRIRVIFGCNEETGSKCMEYYNKVEEPVTLGFTPDGEFPGIHGEKGMLKMTARSKNTKIISIDGGFVSNAVCHHCVTVVSADDVDRDRLERALSGTGLVSYQLSEKDGKITIDADGKAAHASTPELGINAAGWTMKALEEAGMEDDFVKYYNSHIGLGADGAGYGINVRDEYGSLTLNNGIISLKDGQITATVDIRFPVTFTADQLKEMAAPYLEDKNGVTTIDSSTEPLFYPEDSELVQALYSAYVEVTHDTKARPMVIGGGTYAKSVPGIIAFGCQFGETENYIHNANERLLISELQKQVEIYIQAVRNLLKLK